MKNKFWVFVLAVLIVAPTVVACASYFSTKESPVNQNSISSVTLTDLYDEQYTFERNTVEFSLSDIGSNMVQFFTDVNTNSKSEPELPEPLKGTEYYKVTINNYGRDVEYKYYFSEQPEYCYYLDEDDKCFSIDRQYAAAFLNSLYGRSVFDSATLPIMTTPSGETVEPTEVKWTYLAADDMAPTYTASDAAAATDTVYNIAEQVAVAFSIPAGSVNVNVSDDTGELYNGLYENLAFANIPTNTELKVKVDAKWYKTEERQSEGEASYTFKCKVTDKPVFIIEQNAETVVQGDFVNVTGKNIICDPADIKVLSDLDVSPVFYKDRNYVRAIIPVPLGTEAGTHSFTFVADGIEQSLEFTVTDKDYPVKYEEISSTVLNEESMAAFDEAMKDILTAKSDTRYFDGEFIYPVKDSVVSSGYGRPTVTSSGFEYTNEWVRVLASSGSNVLAMNAGKVVYVGEQSMTGKTVVVDHGLGLMSVYGNMTSTSVNVGDTVATGDTLGVSGSAGYADGSTVSVALTVNGTYVCPYEIWDSEGVVFTAE